MNRKDFFKKLGLGAMAVIVAPKVLAKTPELNNNHISEFLQFDELGIRRVSPLKHTYCNPYFHYGDAELDADFELAKLMSDELFYYHDVDIMEKLTIE